MNNQSSGSPPTAVEILQSSRTLPGENTDAELSTIFGGSAAPASPFVNAEEIKDSTSTKVATPMLVESFVRTFVIWRPWESCRRCLHAIEADESILPADEGDYTCPHTQVREFKRTKDACYQGEGAPTREDYSSLKNGTQIVTFAWIQPDEKFKRQEAAKQAAKKKNQIFPPDPEAIFSAPIESEAKGEASAAPPELEE